MKLEEALNICKENQFLARAAWEKDGRHIIKLITTTKKVEDLAIELTEESLNADDWNLYEIKE